MDDNGKVQETSEAASTPAVSGVVLGPNTRVLSNGAVYDNDLKRIVGNPPGGPLTKITQSNAVDFHRLRQEKILAAQVAARKGMANAAKTPSAMGAVAKIAENMAGYAMSERSIGAVKAAEWVTRAAGLVADKESQSAPTTGAVITLSTEALSALTTILADMRAHNGGQDDTD